jgi:hypothetical protein
MLLPGFLRATFGGTICIEHKNPPCHDGYRWTIYGNDAAVFLLQIKDYLILKRKQALLALELQQIRQVPSSHIYRTIEERKRILEIVNEIGRLNLKGFVAINGGVTE